MRVPIGYAGPYTIKFQRSKKSFCDCGRRAVYSRRFGGAAKARKDHDECPSCWKREIAQHRSVVLKIRAVI